MDHQTALLTYAAERYASGQMDAGLMDEFEEHFFSCPECAQAVEDCQMLLANGKVLVSRQKTVAQMPVAHTKQSAWVKWAPMAAAAVFAAGLGYQNLVVYPDLKEQIAEARAPRYVQSVSLRGVTRSETTAPRPISGSSRTLVLSFYPEKAHAVIQYEIFALDGRKVLSGELGKPVIAPSGEAQIALVLDSGIAAGEYDARVFAMDQQARMLIGERRIAIR